MLLPHTRAPRLKSSTSSAGPILPSRTLTHVRSAPSATVDQEKHDTARRASGDSTTSHQINLAALPPNVAEAQLLSSRTGSEPPDPLDLRQRRSGAARAPSSNFSHMRDGATRPASAGQDSCRAPRNQLSHSSTLPALSNITDGSAPSVFDPTLEYSTEHVVLFWHPPSCFSQWFSLSFVADDVS